MGVKTKVFGKFAWIVFEGIARLYDETMTQATQTLSARDKCILKNLMTEFYYLIGFVLPCVYCRISYREFTNPLFPSPTTDLEKCFMQNQPDGMQHLIWCLHNKVNEKLENQELDKADTSQEVKQIKAKWKKHNISFETAKEIRFPSASSQRFWYALIVFLALVMCDYRKEEANYIFEFFKVIGKLLKASHQKAIKNVARLYNDAFEDTLPLWKQDMTLPERLDIVWRLKSVMDIKGWPFDHTRASFEHRCKEAIVGCNPGKK